MPGTYQVGNAPKTLKQKAADQAELLRAQAASKTKQKIQTMAPGTNQAVRDQIAATPADQPISFSDQN